MTDALAESHDAMRQALASGDTDGLEETCEQVGGLLGLEGGAEDPDEEDELDEDPDEQEPEE